MAIYNTGSDSANTGIRAFLTKVGEYYLGRSFNTGNGQGKRDWIKIRDELFEGKCAYCGKSGVALQMEHLIMFNRNEFGLHHPGNIVPCCKECNTRGKQDDGSHMNWDQHLYSICLKKQEISRYNERKLRISRHMQEGEYRYPELSEEEQHAIRVIANSLYGHIKLEIDKSLSLYQDLHESFVKK